MLCLVVVLLFPSNLAPGSLKGAAFDCASTGYDNSTTCTQSALNAINGGRQSEGLAPMALPGDWYSETPTQQLFNALNSERVARGLPGLPESANADAAAQAAANQGNDIDPQPSDGAGTWGGNAAEGYANPLQVVYEWVYNDGPGSPNVDCPSAGSPGCYGHRNNVLRSYPGGVMGTGYNQAQMDWTALFEVPPPPPAAPSPPPPAPPTTVPSTPARVAPPVPAGCPSA